jgi:hypothetical protein
MLLEVLVVCAVGAIVLFGLEAFGDLSEVWSHPEHRADQDSFHSARAKSK